MAMAGIEPYRPVPSSYHHGDTPSFGAIAWYFLLFVTFILSLLFIFLKMLSSAAFVWAKGIEKKFLIIVFCSSFAVLFVGNVVFSIGSLLILSLFEVKIGVLSWGWVFFPIIPAMTLIGLVAIDSLLFLEFFPKYFTKGRAVGFALTLNLWSAVSSVVAFFGFFYIIGLMGKS